MLLNVKAILVKNIKLDRQAEFYMHDMQVLMSVNSPNQLISACTDTPHFLKNCQTLQNQNGKN